ncbi:MAG: M16 family metallopeptidase [Cyclobacteriaceae bacterium]
MIEYTSHTLSNGLEVLVHEDHSTPMAVLNVLYKVGSKHEQPNKTGLAHLFEHLMFGGSVNIPDYDKALQKVGGENNAFTNADITNYYIQLPAHNIETALWLESDRMLSLSFDAKVLEVQKNVVVEEFKQRYLNQPYGEVWLKLMPLAYKIHPYQWPTIGKDMLHVESVDLQDIRDFFYKHYLPNNAVVVVAGNIKTKEILQLVKKWFEDIPEGNIQTHNLPQEPIQTEARTETIMADVPLDAIFKAYHMPGRNSTEYYVSDLMADILGRGKSSRLQNILIKKEKLFNNVSAYMTGNFDSGLLVVSGKTNKGVDIEMANHRLDQLVQEISLNDINTNELEKVKNQAEATLRFGETELLNRAMGLAIGASLGKPNLVNEEANYIQSVQLSDIKKLAKSRLVESNSNTLFYRSSN